MQRRQMQWRNKSRQRKGGGKKPRTWSSEEPNPSRGARHEEKGKESRANNAARVAGWESKGGEQEREEEEEKNKEAVLWRLVDDPGGRVGE